MINMKKLRLGSLLAGAALAVLLPWQSAFAESVLLNSSKMLYKGEQVDVNLYGEALNYGYAHDLLLLLRSADGRIIAGCNPTIEGGYGFNLIPVKLKGANINTEQLIFVAKQGDCDTYSEYRIYDFSDRKNVQELFGGGDNLGVVENCRIEGDKLILKTVNDNKEYTVAVNPKLFSDISANRLKAKAKKLDSLLIRDLDNDGVVELMTNQHIVIHDRVVADVGSVWKYNGPKEEPAADKDEDFVAASNKISDILKAAEKMLKDNAKNTESNSKTASQKQDMWKHYSVSIMKSNILPKDNKFNKGAYFAGSMICPVNIVSPKGVLTYPQFYMSKNYTRQNAWNKVVQEEAEPYLKEYFEGKADMAFEVLRSDNKMVCLRLKSGKTSFTHHYINFLPEKMEKVKLSDIVKTKDEQFIKLLNTLNGNKRVVFDKNLPDEWYIAGNKLHLIQKLDGAEYRTSFELKNIQKFIKHKPLLEGISDK